MFTSGIPYSPFFLFRRFNRLKVSSLQKPPPAFSLTPCIQGINKTLDFFYSTVYDTVSGRCRDAVRRLGFLPEAVWTFSPRGENLFAERNTNHISYLSLTYLIFLTF
jgi:hypothetical protein